MYLLLQWFENASLDAIHVIPLDRRADIHNKHFLEPDDVSCTRNYHRRVSTIERNFVALHFETKGFFAVEPAVDERSLNRCRPIPYITERVQR